MHIFCTLFPRDFVSGKATASWIVGSGGVLVARSGKRKVVMNPTIPLICPVGFRDP